MSDLIDRQNAINAISKKQGGVFDQDAEIDTAVLYVYSECKAIIKDLPSAQPEIIRCRDCEHHSGSYCHYKYSYGAYVRDNHYCGWAERRTDDI